MEHAARWEKTQFSAGNAKNKKLGQLGFGKIKFILKY
jgi:phosphoglycerate dehydrogenase-like enzyme